MASEVSGSDEKQGPSKIQRWLDAWMSKKTQDLIVRWGQRLLVAGVLGLLVYKLAGVGWQDLWRDLPMHPLFYLIFVLMYLGLPVAESIIYRLIWGVSFKEIFPIMIKKRVFNKDVLNYSGEANLFLWAKKHVGRSGRQILSDIKDNTIISSLTSLFIAAGLLSTFLFMGILPWDAIVGELKTSWIIGGGFCIALLVALAIRFRKSVITFPKALVGKLFGLHVGRLFFVQTLQVLQWMVVMPEAPVGAWLTILSAQIIANQIPLAPQKDLLVAAFGPDLAGWLGISASGVTSMLLVTAMLDKLVNFTLFSYVSFKERQGQDEQSS